ncbi:MAG: hypothetical protein GX847_10560 [Clostridiales bacterium]|nr:hypothetical protein [Clostridiales bacterium]
MFKRDLNRTPKQRADKALMNIVARLGGCGFLVYFVVQMMTVPAEEKPDPTTATIVSAVFILIAAFLIFITIKDAIVGFKTGRFKASTYEDMDLAEYMESQKDAAADEASTGEQAALEASADTDTEPDAEEDTSEDEE